MFYLFFLLKKKQKCSICFIYNCGRIHFGFFIPYFSTTYLRKFQNIFSLLNQIPLEMYHTRIECGLTAIYINVDMKTILKPPIKESAIPENITAIMVDEPAMRFIIVAAFGRFSFSSVDVRYSIKMSIAACSTKL